MSNYEEEIISQNVVNLISEEKLQEMEASGTVPPNQEFLTPDDIEDIPVDCIRTEVVYDNRSANKHWDYEDGIPSGTTVTGKDFSKYVKLIVHTYQAGTIGGVRGSCEVDLTQPSLQWDGSEQTYYAGSNVYYCNYIDDGSDDYVLSRTCMALVDSTKTSITVYSTKTGKYHQQVNDGKIFMIEGVLKTPAMIYTGEELHEGEGIEIKDGVVSQKVISKATSSVQIPGGQSFTGANYQTVASFTITTKGGRIFASYCFPLYTSGNVAYTAVHIDGVNYGHEVRMVGSTARHISNTVISPELSAGTHTIQLIVRGQKDSNTLTIPSYETGYLLGAEL